MKKLKTFNFKPVTFILLFSFIVISATAQKLPNIQASSLRAPENIKIDGKATEWDDTFQAYNKSTEVYYTISNNKDNLYLVIQAPKVDVITKIFSGGITLSIKNTDKKNIAVPVTITYPLFPPHGNPGTSKLNGDGPITDDDLDALNKKIADVKEIRVTGIKEIPDTMVSVYNEQGIKSIALINNKKTYTYELAISLKYLTALLDATGTFAYNVKLNGMEFKNMTGTINGQPITSANSAQAASLLAEIMNSPNARSSGNGTSLQSMMSATDFSGTYTLAKN